MKTIRVLLIASVAEVYGLPAQTDAFLGLQVRSNCRRYFLSSRALNAVYDVVTWAVTQLSVSYTVAPFVMLAVEPTISLYKWVSIVLNCRFVHSCFLCVWPGSGWLDHSELRMSKYSFEMKMSIDSSGRKGLSQGSQQTHSKISEWSWREAFQTFLPYWRDARTMNFEGLDLIINSRGWMCCPCLFFPGSGYVGVSGDILRTGQTWAALMGTWRIYGVSCRGGGMRWLRPDTRGLEGKGVRPLSSAPGGPVEL